ncbi:hypothetical protein OS493_006391 [Desmophyllum pertusum]|uniref:Uncharacterized protein n=1 Tax=Desmophyllum pertusum TaxID=174260 RepID=A0A9X0DC68_9CNID|nr:hypothetical protein OS493_006391 [Desmophyllum pertusum]
MVPACALSTSPPMLGNTRSTTAYSLFRCSCTNSSMTVSNAWHRSSRGAPQKLAGILRGADRPQCGTIAVSLSWYTFKSNQNFPVRSVVRRIAAIKGRYSSPAQLMRTE